MYAIIVLVMNKKTSSPLKSILIEADFPRMDSQAPFIRTSERNCLLSSVETLSYSPLFPRTRNSTNTHTGKTHFPTVDAIPTERPRLNDTDSPRHTIILPAVGVQHHRTMAPAWPEGIPLVVPTRLEVAARRLQ